MKIRTLYRTILLVITIAVGTLDVARVEGHTGHARFATHARLDTVGPARTTLALSQVDLAPDALSVRAPFVLHGR